MDQNTDNQPLRPSFHFTAQRGWLNDPNGLVYHQGTYHLFFQHNPYGTDWGNMTWGHAVGPDLVHWRQLDNALCPDDLGTIFSGTALVDHRNVLGLQRDATPTLALFYTAAGNTSDASAGKPFTQCLATSTDGGRTFVKHPANPILPCIQPGNRDPRVFWHEQSGRYVMVLYVGHPHPTEVDGNGNPVVSHAFHFLTSHDLLTWEDQSRLPGLYECPDLFELPVEGTGETYWVLWDASGRYLIGHFDGQRFESVSEPLTFDYGANYYAAQCFANLPPARHVSIAWMRGGRYPDMPFNQQLSFPSELTLRRDPDGLRVYRQPVAEIANLYLDAVDLPVADITGEQNLISAAQGPAHDVTLSLSITPDTVAGINVCGHAFRLDAQQQTLSFADFTMPLQLADGQATLRLLIDRTSVEIYADNGRAAGSWCFVPVEGAPVLSLARDAGKVRFLGATSRGLRPG